MRGAETAIEAFDISILGRLAGVDEIEPHAVIIGPSIQRPAPELRAVINGQNIGISAFPRHPFQHFNDAGAWDRQGHINGRAFHAWTIEEITQFEDKHEIGTTARLALALALYTGQRRSDLVALGPPKILIDQGRNWLEFTQNKNRTKSPVRLTIPIIPKLQEIIDAATTGETTFLINGYGRPYTAKGFGNRFRKWCDEAGLPKSCAVHGLRKAAAARLAESGCTEQEIMAITGHKTSKEIIRYTKSARQKVRAESALKKLG